MRLGLAAFAVVLATLLVPIGITSTWLSLRVDSTEAYVDTVAPLADNDELRERLADEVADTAIATLQGNVPVGLPSGLEKAVRASTKEVVESPGFPKFWRQASADTHREFLGIVHDKDENVIHDGWVVIDVSPLLDEVLKEFAEQYGIPAALLPPSAPLPLPVVPESRLEQARGAYQVLDWLSLWVPLIWAGLVAVAVIVAPGWRGRLRVGAAGAIGAAIGGVLVLLLTGPVTDAVVDQVDAENQGLARLVVEVVVATLDDSAMTVVIGGLVIGAGLLVASFVPGRRTATG